MYYRNINFKWEAKIIFQKFIMNFKLEKTRKKLNPSFSDNTTLCQYSSQLWETLAAAGYILEGRNASPKASQIQLRNHLRACCAWRGTALRHL